jgi:Arc/MetJ-type ribon-helix-helix transcriptional regulator
MDSNYILGDMLMMQTVQVRFTKEELRFIDQQVRENKYPSRSEAIRDCIRKVQFLQALSDFRRLAQQLGLSEDDLMSLDKSSRKDLFEKFFSSPSLQE